MRFDCTHGNKAKYIVSLYGWDVEDHFYCDTFKNAKRIFNIAKGTKFRKGTALSLYNIQKDIRKEYVKF